jgi:hypothetical protein
MVDELGGCSRDTNDAFAAETPPRPAERLAAVAMPWAISILFHLGLLLVLALTTMITIRHNDPAGAAPVFTHLAEADTVDFPTTPPSDEIEADTDSSAEAGRRIDSLRQLAVGDSESSTDSQLISLVGSSTPGAGGPGLEGRGAGAGGTVKTLDQVFRASHVVWVIDRSGSMVDTFDSLRLELLESIGGLDAEAQDFHLILFAGGKPLEKKSRRLTPATNEYKVEAAEFLDTIRPEGSTDPVAAIRRAFAVLDDADARPGKVIVLLTDADFPDNQKVLQTVRSLNRDGDVRVYTTLFGNRGGSTKLVLETIANENGGGFSWIRPGE